jgi:hypothetical protein
MNTYMTPQQMASQGRYGDSMLMHVSPGEVRGLQALAVHNGTSLTTNPTTGLPEAFSLKKLLPTLIGAGLMMIPGVAPWMIGAGVGGVETLRTGDLGKGLLAGLGAYGGAGMASGALAAGAGAAGGTGTAAGAMATPGTAGMMPDPSFFGNLQQAGTGVSNMFSAGDVGAQARNAFLGQAADPKLGTPATGIGGGTGAAKAFGSLAMPLMPEPEPAAFPNQEDPYAKYKGPYKPTERRVSYPSQVSSREWNYFTPSNPIPYADGGETTDRAMQRPDAGYNVNQGEFDYNFRPVEMAKAATSPAAIGGKGAGVGNQIVGYTSSGDPIYSRNPNEDSGFDFGGIRSSFAQRIRDLLGRTAGGTSGTDKNMSGYKYDPATQQMVKMATGGSVPQLEDGGFVLTKKAVDGLGKGDNKRGQKVASKGLGALPIKGKGHGTSDSIKTSIDGKVPALVSNGESYVPKRNVQKAGGAKNLYALMRKAERKA